MTAKKLYVLLLHNLYGKYSYEHDFGKARIDCQATVPEIKINSTFNILAILTLFSWMFYNCARY